MDDSSEANKKRQGVHLMSKPVGPICNLSCDYCFYLEKKAFFPDTKTLMPDEILRAYTKKYIEYQKSPIVEFVWQGGEPTLAGLDFYKRAIHYQKKYANGKTIKNSFQTNGILIDDEWCRFFYENDFLIGLSLDGPKEIHDLYRNDKNGKGSFVKVIDSAKNLKKHNVKFNVMACVGKETARNPLSIYGFFKDFGIDFIQFTPIVERVACDESREKGLALESPSNLSALSKKPEMAEWSVQPNEYGEFLIKIFDEWVRNDVGRVYVMNFEWTLASWLGLPSSICIFSKHCGRSLIVENNGDIYSCDHFMYPEYKVGNMLDNNLNDTVDSMEQISFGEAKEKTLTEYCKKCRFLFVCRGGCPKQRFTKAPNGEEKHNYLCPAYKSYFSYTSKYMRAMAELIKHNLPVSKIMEAIDNPVLLNLNKDKSSL